MVNHRSSEFKAQIELRHDLNFMQSVNLDLRCSIPGEEALKD